MSKQHGFGAAIPKDQWIARTVTQDPNPRIPFSYGPKHSPDTFPSIQKWEKIGWSFAIGFWVAFLLLCKAPW